MIDVSRYGPDQVRLIIKRPVARVAGGAIIVTNEAAERLHRALGEVLATPYEPFVWPDPEPEPTCYADIVRQLR